MGYLVSVLAPAAATALSLWPRSTRGPRATPTFIFASVANELPFIIVYWLVADTVLAATEGDIDSPLGWVALAITACTAAGSAVVIGRAARARPVLNRALDAGLGQNRPGAAKRQDPGRHDRARVPLRALVAPLRIPARAVRRERNISYGPAGRENQLDVYRHRSNPLGCPVLLYFHPGGFFSGRKSRESRALFEGLVRAGWVCISANYRLGRAGRFPNNLVDAKRAIAWIRAHAADYGVDSSTLVVCGGSAGAYLTAMCALSANDQAFQPSFEKADTSVSAAVGLYGFYGTPPDSEHSPASPGAYVRADAPPFLVVHGAHDPMINAAHAREFVECLRGGSKMPVLYAEIPGGQHNFDRFPSIRAFAVVDAIEVFGTWVRTQSRP